MNAFDRALEECLEGLRGGSLSIDECLRRYPQHAERLRAHLLAAAAVARAYGAATPSEDFAASARARFLVASGQSLQEAFDEATPREEFAGAARERFLVATGEQLGDAYDVEPSPSFFAAARVRFLMTAHRMRRERAEQARPRGLSLMPGLRAVGMLAAVVTAFAAFSTYTVASAESALPGDWQYPIKLKTERVRLALAFGDGAKRNVRLHRAKERANEIAELAQHGETIGPAELHRLVSQTAPLVEEANSNWDNEDLAKLQDVSATQEQALALAEPQVESGAHDELVQAKQVAQDAFVQATTAIVRQDAPVVITPTHRLTSTPEAAATSTPPPEATATVGDGIAADGTPAATQPAGTPSATPTSTATPVRPISIGTPVGDALGVTWIRLSVGQMTALMPSLKDGWYIQGVNVADEHIPSPTLVHLSNVDATSLVTINTRNGDVYWLIAHGGRFDEVQMRLDRDGEVLVVDRDVLHNSYGKEADIPLYILDSVVIAPLPATPTP